MGICIECYPVMPRPCGFCLCLQEGSVYADFDRDDDGIVSLRRISFDGYGCCKIKDRRAGMSKSDSQVLLDAKARGELGGVEIEEILRRFFREHLHAIWNDALSEHDLL